MDAGTVLIVEDEPDAREILSEFLGLKGFHVVEASNGAEAWKFLQNSGPPCLIILDINMPVMDGRQFRALQMRDPGLAKIPVVLISALGASATADLGATAVIRKPIDVEALLQVVESNCWDVAVPSAPPTYNHWKTCQIVASLEDLFPIRTNGRTSRTALQLIAVEKLRDELRSMVSSSRSIREVGYRTTCSSINNLPPRNFIRALS